MKHKIYLESEGKYYGIPLEMLGEVQTTGEYEQYRLTTKPTRGQPVNTWEQLLKAKPRTNWIKELRQRNGLTQSDLAVSLGVAHKVVVSTWERGESFPAKRYWDSLIKLGAKDIKGEYIKYLNL